MIKGEQLYSGKAKTVFLTDDPERLILHFRNDTSAFDGVKLAQLERKGEMNNRINAFVMAKLADGGIDTHFIERIGPEDSVVRRLDMIRVECVIRNVVAGSLAKRLGIEEGLVLERPVFEFFLKDDALHDPMINESHILAFGWASAEEIEQMREASHAVNGVLKELFDGAGIMLVDFKLEFGRAGGKLWLGDEFTPDGCRLWDASTHRKLDKDRFRRDLGEVVESYQEVARRLGVPLQD
ncbi:MAG: phosphoribosylaminoimidazolesuccinocarboxamide synthase [Gammaproteobacteria bacterium]|nr:phosphoribosylaminoimidazolesuccinocarboxamide synthase [Gammaproteobacteria bacterium]